MASAAQPVQALVRMEIVQACGLLAAVNAAEQWSEGAQAPDIAADMNKTSAKQASDIVELAHCECDDIA